MSKHPTRGFTLIELMITVAIVAILAAVAYPAYTDQVRKGRRAELRTVLLDAAQWMERFYTENQSYARNAAGTATTDSGVFYAAFRYSPKSTATPGSYELTLTVNNATPNAYTITAAPIGNMTGDKCGTYFVNQLGTRGNTGFTGFSSAADAARSCWK